MESLLELLSAGMTIDEVLADYPDLERDDLLAALEFGALAAGRHRVIPLGADAKGIGRRPDRGHQRGLPSLQSVGSRTSP